jgi:branched-subunit amino acid transport protein
MTFNDYLLLFGGMGLATYLPRALPLLYLAHKKMPQWLIDWLSLIPVAILSALIAPSLLADAATRSFAFGKLELLVAFFEDEKPWRNGAGGNVALLVRRDGLGLAAS